MKISTHIHGLKQLQNQLRTLSQPQIVEEAARQTQDEIQKLNTRPSLLFINHVLRGFLRDAMRAARR